jgi:hypothetical protein
MYQTSTNITPKYRQTYLGAGHYDSDILTGWIFNGFNSAEQANYRVKYQTIKMQTIL